MSELARSPRQGAARRIGRFALIEEIGHGAQATVWRAHDERLDRDVALKLLRPDADTLAVSQWLHEARAVSRLAHPNIVPVFEADDCDGNAYLVFELVRGRTLADLRRQRGAMPPREAAALMLGVLDALRAAHDQGIVHRDLKPSNVLVDADGRPRVMDFGIAARVADSADGRIVGTPGFMSPEAAQGMAPMPRMDVFSAGMLLANLLAGRPILREADPHRALHRVIHEDLVLPGSVAVDDELRSIVHRAIARDPTLRYDGAGVFRDALAQWLNPEAAPDPGASSADAQGTLNFLLRRMRHRSDFPALSDAVARIHRVTASESESLGSLANEILKDVALTNKLLRLVNSAHFSNNAEGGVSTVSRAVALVGFAGIRNLALSLVLFEHMKNKDHATRLKSEFLQALLAGQIAGELSHNHREQEEAFLGAMFRNLGRLLAEYYFPDEAQQINDRMHDAPADGDLAAQREQMVAEKVLGIRYDALGLGVARSWGLPENLQHCMHLFEGAPPTRAANSAGERLRCLAAVGNEAAALLLAPQAPGAQAERVKLLAERYGRSLGLNLADFQQAMVRAELRLSQTAPIMGLALPGGKRAAAAAASRTSLPAADTLSPYAIEAMLRAAPAAAADSLTTAASQAAARLGILAAGIQDVTQTMAADQFRLNEVLRMILETMFRALGLQRVLFCLRDTRGDVLHGRFGLGEQAMALAQHFQIPLRPASLAASNLFSTVCLKGADTLISNATAPSIAARLPDWFHAKIGASAFLLLPLLLKGAPFALIYADMADDGVLALGEQEFAMMRTLRNQAVMAFRQTGG